MTSQQADDKLGKLAYDAYCMQTGGVSLISGVTLPPWDGLQTKYQTAWIAAARTVEAHIMAQYQDDAA